MPVNDQLRHLVKLSRYINYFINSFASKMSHPHAALLKKPLAVSMILCYWSVHFTDVVVFSFQKMCNDISFRKRTTLFSNHFFLYKLPLYLANYLMKKQEQHNANCTSSSPVALLSRTMSLRSFRPVSAVPRYCSRRDICSILALSRFRWCHMSSGFPSGWAAVGLRRHK